MTGKSFLNDKQRVVHIISSAFDQNPSVNQVIKSDSKRNSRIKSLAAYAYETAKVRKGVFISSDKNGVALCYRFNQKKEGLNDYLNQLKLVINSISPERVFKILKREAYVKSKRPASGDYLYFWMLGVNEEGRGRGAARELKNLIFSLSKNLQLPIYLETSVPQNKRVYERYGFMVYHIWSIPGENLCMWFMKREAE